MLHDWNTARVPSSWMPKIHYYGNKTNFIGKTLFEVLANLRNFGINRMLIKQEELLKNPGKKCYYIVKKVEPIMDKELKEGAIYAEHVFCNARVPGLVFVDDLSWHTDWQLIPKHEEEQHRVKDEVLLEHGHPDTMTVLPRWMKAPPLMDVFLRRHYEMRKTTPKANLRFNKSPMEIMMHYDFARMNQPHKVYRIAEEGEEVNQQQG